ncbi:hypothetical protein B0H11DRAFT_1941444 [Mycena galericulata]|nr:hypothetical protein B0H11DRAFT_1941444 [Mycena galericulata]
MECAALEGGGQCSVLLSKYQGETSDWDESTHRRWTSEGPTTSLSSQTVDRRQLGHKRRWEGEDERERVGGKEESCLTLLLWNQNKPSFVPRARHRPPRSPAVTNDTLGWGCIGLAVILWASSLLLHLGARRHFFYREVFPNVQLLDVGIARRRRGAAAGRGAGGVDVAGAAARERVG